MGKLWCVVFAVVLAGCSSDATPEEAETARGLSIEAPVWQVGDSWTYSNRDAQGGMSGMAIVVTGEEGGDYTVDTNEPTVAYYHALDEISYLGKVRKSDLAGSQGGDRVQYFDFPLEADKTWSTTWDGERVQVRVTEVTAETARMEAHAGQRLFAEYSYGQGFIEDITFYDENGTAFTMELTSQDSGFAGTVYRYNLEDPREFVASETQLQSALVPLGDSINEIGITANGTCGGAQAGSMGAVLSEREPDEQHVPQFLVAVEEPVYLFQLDCRTDQEATDQVVIEVDPAKSYHIDIGAAAQGSRLQVDIEPRTRLEIAVG